MDILHATSYSSALDFAHLANCAMWSIRGHHRHACNLLSTDGTWIALVNEMHGNGPFHIVIPSTRFDTLPNQAEVEWQTRTLRVGPITVALDRASAWNPHLPTIARQDSLRPLIPHLAQLRLSSPLFGGAPALIKRAQQGIECLQRGFSQQSIQLIAKGSNLLAGLGPGLTPSGDDFLVGLMAALIVAPNHAASAHRNCQIIAASAMCRTTRLSAAWLYHASQGRFGEQWHRLIDAINSGYNSGGTLAIDQAFSAIAVTGATSGVDALGGFHCGIEISIMKSDGEP